MVGVCDLKNRPYLCVMLNDEQGCSYWDNATSAGKLVRAKEIEYFFLQQNDFLFLVAFMFIGYIKTVQFASRVGATRFSRPDVLKTSQDIV